MIRSEGSIQILRLLLRCRNICDELEQIIVPTKFEPNSSDKSPFPQILFTTLTIYSTTTRVTTRTTIFTLLQKDKLSSARAMSKPTGMLTSLAPTMAQFGTLTPTASDLALALQEKETALASMNNRATAVSLTLAFLLIFIIAFYALRCYYVRQAKKAKGVIM